MFEKIKTILDAHHARYRIISHPPEGSSEKVAEIRGTHPGQGAKAMLCRVKGQEYYALAVLPGDWKLDFKKLAEATHGKKTALVTPDEAYTLTGCRIGAIPPFSFTPNIRLIVDPRLLKRFDEIAFNAGRLDTSIVLNAEDYARIAMPMLSEIASLPEPEAL